MRLLTYALGAAAVVVLGGCGSAPAETPPAATTKTPAAATAPSPAPLSFGQHHHPIRTSNPEVQRLFDQGMAQAFGFNIVPARLDSIVGFLNALLLLLVTAGILNNPTTKNKGFGDDEE